MNRTLWTPRFTTRGLDRIYLNQDFAIKLLEKKVSPEGQKSLKSMIQRGGSHPSIPLKELEIPDLMKRADWGLEFYEDTALLTSLGFNSSSGIPHVKIEDHYTSNLVDTYRYILETPYRDHLVALGYQTFDSKRCSDEETLFLLKAFQGYVDNVLMVK